MFSWSGARRGDCIKCDDSDSACGGIWPRRLEGSEEGASATTKRSPLSLPREIKNRQLRPRCASSLVPCLALGGQLDAVTHNVAMWSAACPTSRFSIHRRRIHTLEFPATFLCTRSLQTPGSRKLEMNRRLLDVIRVETVSMAVACGTAILFLIRCARASALATPDTSAGLRGTLFYGFFRGCTA